MIRGTTAPFTFKLPCVKGRLVSATVKFWQDGNPGTKEAKLPITKKLEDCAAYESDDIKNVAKWDNGEYEDIKKDLEVKYSVELIGRSWNEVSEEIQHEFASLTYDELCIVLEPHETLRFSDKTKAKVQLRAQKDDKTVFASHMQLVTVYPIDRDLATDDYFPEEEENVVILNGGEIIF